MTTQHCVVCGVYHGGGWRGRKRYCSKSCEWKQLKGDDFNARISKESSARRGDRLRHGGRGNGYVKRMGRHEHRLVMEAMLGRKLKRSEIVHHIDHDKSNNAPSNLQVMSRAEHMRAHGMGITGVLPHRFRSKAAI